MSKLKFDLKISKSQIKKVNAETKTTVKKSLRVIAQDLARTSSETAPHKVGDLEDSYTVEYQFSGDELTATVEYAVFKNGFNYAIAMHEWTYNLGEGSQAKGGGTGMSGTTYPVGNKFLTRVHEGEADAYQKYIAEQIRKQLGG